MQNVRQQYYSNGILNSWNMLPTEVVSAPSLNAVKADWIAIGGSINIASTLYIMCKSNVERTRPDTGYVV